MYKNNSFLAIIPARKGSKRLPNKNILNICGKPLVYWTFKSALQSKFLTDIVVTSDDSAILKLANKLSIKTITRPKELATDTTDSLEVILHTIKSLEKKYDYIVLLQPTSPLRKSKSIDDAIKLLIDKKAKSIISVCEVEHPIQWSIPLNSELIIDDEIKKIENKRSQDLLTHYRINGAIYIINTKEMIKQKRLLLKKDIYAYKMKKSESIDIDDKIDFICAEAILKNS